MLHRFFISKIMCAGIAFVAMVMQDAADQVKRVSQQALPEINLAEIADGDQLPGGFVFQHRLLQVAVTVADQQIKKIKVVNGLTSEEESAATNAAMAKVLETQTLDIPAPEGESPRATAARKATLLAIHGALTRAPMPVVKSPRPSSAPTGFFFLGFIAFCASLGTQIAGFMAFRSGNLRAAGGWVMLEDAAFMGGAACCGLAVCLAMLPLP